MVAAGSIIIVANALHRYSCCAQFPLSTSVPVIVMHEMPIWTDLSYQMLVFGTCIERC